MDGFAAHDYKKSRVYTRGSHVYAADLRSFTMVSVLAVNKGILSIVPLFLGMFPEQSSQPYFAGIRVTAGVNGASPIGGKPLSNAQGRVAGIHLYDQHKQWIGGKSLRFLTDVVNFVPSGGYGTFYIGQESAQAAAYLELVASDDALCIPAITMTGTTGIRRGWLGDWGKACGLNWYVSDYFVSEETDYRPACTWIDADHSNGIRAGSITIHLPTFSTSQIPTNRAREYCGPHAFTASGGGKTIFKRGNATVPRRKFDNRLVISSRTAHNATELCTSETSLGPDFVSLSEGVYCNMETRELLPVCSQGATDCFHVENKKIARQDSHIAAKEFSEIIQWTG